MHPTASAVAGTEAVDRAPARAGWSFVAQYALSFTGNALVFIAPLLVTLALKVDDLVGIHDAAKNLALVTGTGSILAMASNPVFGRFSDRTTARLGMRRPWMLAGLAGGTTGTLVVAVAPSIPVVLVGWCLTQVAFNALLAAQSAVLPDQVPAVQRGAVSGVLGVCTPVASVAGTYLVQAFTGHELAMFLVPCVVGGAPIVLFAARLRDRRLDPAAKPPWSLRELAGSLYVNPRRHPDFAWAFLSRFMLVTGFAFLVTYQAYYLIEQLGSTKGDVPHQIFLGTLAQSVVLVVASPLAGRVSDRIGRRKVFVAVAAVVYAGALLMIAAASDLSGYLTGMAVSGLGFGMYMAVDLALVVDVLPSTGSSAKDLGVLNIASALPFALAPALAPALLALGDGSYAVLYTIAGGCALIGAVAILPVRGVR
jgi:MFS family permease